VTFVRGTGAHARLFRTNNVGDSPTKLTFGPRGDGDPAGTFRDKAADDQTKANLEQAIADANQIYDEDSSYAGVTSDRLATVDPSLTWLTGASTGPNVMSWKEGFGFYGSDQAVGFAALTPSGLCFLIKDTNDWPPTGHVSYGFSSTPANCTGTYARLNALVDDWAF
jgi:hypothetical protein